MRKIFILFVATAQILFTVSPAAILALESAGDAGSSTTEASTSIVETCPKASGTNSPTGSSSHTFVFNPQTCLWENPYYTWDPVSKIKTPLYDNSYQFNPNTDRYEKITWVYSPGMNGFRAVISIQNTGPDSTNTINSDGNNDATISNTGPNSNNVIEDPVGDTSITNTGPNSNNEANTGSINNTGPESDNIINLDNDSEASLDSAVSVDVNNDINSIALTGDATVSSNTLGGNATTGEASGMVNMINLIQSAVGLDGVAPQVYTANIQGDYVGDIVIDVDSLDPSTTTPHGYNDLEVNSTVDGTITNNVDLLTQSGKATVKNNTEAGDATSGDAKAVANIVNMINSSIATGQSFIGVLNVNGNLEGDVLLADNFLDTLIAANIPTLELCVTCSDSQDVDIDIDNNHSITNNINATATSGQAMVSNNTIGGNATSGNADTKVTVFNLTGAQVVADNALLVFVNVMGQWVGFITNAPQGSTAAALGSGLDANASRLPMGSDSTEYNIDNDFSIVNNINASAVSGDAAVVSNTSAGNATSGDASTIVNTANITNSTFGLTDWFGMLFINVYGDWHGSFGTDTIYGNVIVTPLPRVLPDPTNSNAGNTPKSTSVPSNNEVRVFTIDSVNDGGEINFTELTDDNNSTPSTTTNKSDVQGLASLASTIEDNPAALNSDSVNSWLIIGGVAAFVILAERTLFILRRN